MKRSASGYTPGAKPDIDPQETRESDALAAVIEEEGAERAHYLLERLVDKARRSGAYLPYNATTAYVNTIPVHSRRSTPATWPWNRASRR
jgi:pyruvate dehydrogenase E1 component